MENPNLPSSLQEDDRAQLSLLPNWRPVTVEEVHTLIGNLKSGKAPGKDFIPAELITSNQHWWAPLLAALFTVVNNSGKVPYSWKHAIVVPIFKRGHPNVPSNYRPISLLSIIGKLYAHFLSSKLTTFLNEHNILSEAQAAFRENHSTTDHCLMLSFLAEKYTRHLQGKLFVAFMDLKSAFDSIPRSQLWSKLSLILQDKRLLFLIKALYNGTKLQVRCGRQGQLSNSIEMTRGVRQGCILAPTLFCLFLNDLEENLMDPDGHIPKIGMRRTPLLLYADDAAIISRSRPGLNYLLRKFSDYCSGNGLSINYEKSKILVFERRFSQSKWVLDGHNLEQVKYFSYLGLTFHHTGSWKHHWQTSLQKAEITKLAIHRFFFTKGGKYVPAALRVFNAKPVSQLLYAANVWHNGDLPKLDGFQAKFIRSLLQVPNCVPNSVLLLEAGECPISARAWWAALRHWLRISVFNLGKGLYQHLTNEEFVSKWQKTMAKKATSIGLSPPQLYYLGYEGAQKVLKQRLWDNAHSDLRSRSHAVCSPLAAGVQYGYVFELTSYIKNLTVPNYRRLFTKARLNVFPSAVLDGRLRGVPYQDRLCSCAQDIDSINHILLHCAKYEQARAELILPLLVPFPGKSEAHYVRFLLEDRTKARTLAVAKFLSVVARTNEPYIPNKVLD
uniref:Reverse transcriptase domain-containing protein n=1 Tax=Podarcis muralis TaxID=64176 RepID=A0A670HYS7_PODMU